MPPAVAAETTTDPQIDTIQQAFEQAKVEQSQDQAPPAEASTASTTEDATSQDTTKALGATTERADDPNDLVSDAQFASIQAQFPGDPAKQRAELNKAFTQKTQKLAPYAKLIESYEKDAKATIETLAKQHGLTVGPPVESTATTTTAATIADQAIAQVKASLGPELDFLAEPLGKAIHQVAELVAKSVTESTVKPLQEQQTQITTRAAKEQVASVMKQFETKYPDWKTHEPAMETLSRQIQPNGMAELDYLDLLYSHVTREAREKTVAESATKKALEKMTKAAEGAETRTDSTSETKVKETRKSPNSIQEAFAMAKRGERVED